MSSHRCCWTKRGRAFEAWLAAKPGVKGRGSSFQDAVENLRAAIRDSLDMWEPAMAFWPPQPIAANKQRFVGDWLLLGPSGHFSTVSASTDGLFEGGFCPACNEPIGKRTVLPLHFEFERLEQADLRRVGTNKVWRVVVSSEFVHTFMGGEVDPAELMPCKNIGGPIEKSYFEVHPLRPLLEAPIRHARTQIFKCGRCGSVRPSNMYPVAGISQFVLRAHLDQVSRSWASLLEGMGIYSIIVRAQTVDPIKMAKGSKDVAFDWLGIADEEDVWNDAPVTKLPR